MAAAGGHWVKGSFTPAGGGAGGGPSDQVNEAIQWAIDNDNLTDEEMQAQSDYDGFNSMAGGLADQFDLGWEEIRAELLRRYP